MVDTPPREAGASGAAHEQPREDDRKAAAIEALVEQYKSDHDERSKHDRKVLFWGRGSVLVAGFYVVLTAALLGAGVYSAIQASLAVDAANQSAKAANKSVDAANKAADASTMQAQIAADTEERQLRAYVAVISGIVLDFATGRALLTGITSKNFGLTPAYHVSLRYIRQIAVTRPDNKYPIVDYRTLYPGVLDSTTLYPGQEKNGKIASPSPIVLTQEHVLAIQQGREVILHYGTVYYEDTFKNKRGTDFCFVFNWEQISAGTWSACNNHQGTDDESEGDLPKSRT